MYITSSDAANYQFLDQIFLRAGSDKSSRVHNYTSLYSRLFHAIKDRPLKLLEIGIYFGDSVKGWEEYFPNAELHFIDNNMARVKYASTRSHYHLLDQEHAPSLDRFIEGTGGNFDVIIDDGGHKSTQQISSFEKLFPTLKSGGIYIIEDLFWCLHSPNYVQGEFTTFEFVKSLFDQIHQKGIQTLIGSHLKISKEIQEKLNFYQDQIDLMIIQNGLAVITRR